MECGWRLDLPWTNIIIKPLCTAFEGENNLYINSKLWNKMETIVATYNYGREYIELPPI
jgi:hypothetical protein